MNIITGMINLIIDILDRITNYLSNSRKKQCELMELRIQFIEFLKCIRSSPKRNMDILLKWEEDDLRNIYEIQPSDTLNFGYERFIVRLLSFGLHNMDEYFIFKNSEIFTKIFDSTEIEFINNLSKEYNKYIDVSRKLKLISKDMDINLKNRDSEFFYINFEKYYEVFHDYTFHFYNFMCTYTVNDRYKKQLSEILYKIDKNLKMEKDDFSLVNIHNTTCEFAVRAEKWLKEIDEIERNRKLKITLDLGDDYKVVLPESIEYIKDESKIYFIDNNSFKYDEIWNVKGIHIKENFYVFICPYCGQIYCELLLENTSMEKTCIEDQVSFNIMS